MSSTDNNTKTNIHDAEGGDATSHSAEMPISELQQQLADQLRSFEQRVGRRPRILLAKVGQDGHDRGQKVVASAFADFGFDVDVGPLFQMPAEIVKSALENDVHILGISSQAAGHLTLVPQIKKELESQGVGDIMLVVGGVIPETDHSTLYDLGVACIFGPGTSLPHAAIDILTKLNKTQD